MSLGPARTPGLSLCTQTAAEGARNTETHSLHLSSPTEWRLSGEALEKGIWNSLLAPVRLLRFSVAGMWLSCLMEMWLIMPEYLNTPLHASLSC